MDQADSRDTSGTSSQSDGARSRQSRTRKTAGRRKKIGRRQKQGKKSNAPSSRNDEVHVEESSVVSESGESSGYGQTTSSSGTAATIRLSSSEFSWADYEDGVSEELSLDAPVEEHFQSSSSSSSLSNKTPVRSPFYRSRKEKIRFKAERRRRHAMKQKTLPKSSFLQKKFGERKLRPLRLRGKTFRKKRDKKKIMEANTSSEEDTVYSPAMSFPSREGSLFIFPDPQLMNYNHDNKEFEWWGSALHMRNTDITEELKKNVLIEQKWIVSCQHHHSVQLLRTSPYYPDLVERSITFSNCEDLIIIVNGMELPPDHEIFLFKKHLSDPENFSEIVFGLEKIATYVINYEICKGDRNQNHHSLWEKFTEQGKIDIYSDVTTFRSKKCSLLLQVEGMCENCHDLTKKLKREASRKKSDSQGKDTSKTNLRYMSSEELTDRLRERSKQVKVEKEKNRRLRMKIASMIVKSSVPVDKEMSDDLMKILEEKYPLMTDMQKMFWGEQLKALEAQANPKTMRWHPMMIRVALHLRMISAAAYDYCQQVQFVALPSSRRLYDYSHVIEAKEGCQQEILDDIKKKIEKMCLEDYQNYFNLLFDEMSVRANLVYNKNGELIGYVNLSEVEKELKKLEAMSSNEEYEPPIAKKILAFMITGITTDVRDIIAIYSTDNLTSYQLYRRAWEVIYFAEGAGIRILTMIFDGASINRRFLHMHKPQQVGEVVYATKNIASGDFRPIFFILDPPHLLKTIRNCLANSYSHTQTRQLWKNGEYLRWEVFKILLSITSGMKFKGHKLTEAHIKLTPFSKMTVSLAAQTLSHFVQNCLIKYKDHPSLASHDTEELAKFIALVDKFWDCVNTRDPHKSSKPQKPDKDPYRSEDDPRLDFLVTEFPKYFQDWSEEVMQRPGNYSQKEKSCMVLSHQTLEAISITTKSVCAVVKLLLQKGAPCVETKYLNQDPLEQYFGKVRHKGGSDDNPDLAQALNIRRNLHVQQSAALPKKRGNTEVLESKMVCDESPLPALKRSKHDK